MSNRNLSRLHIGDAAEKLAKVGIMTAKDIFDESPFQLQMVLNMSYVDVQKLLAHVSSRIAPAPHNALEIFHERLSKMCFLPCGVPVLDTHMHGGLAVGTLTEVCGPPGIGKTQFCATTCAHTMCSALQRYSGKVTLEELCRMMTTDVARVIYIDTELKFDGRRVIEIAKYCLRDVLDDYFDSYSLEQQTMFGDIILQSIQILRPLTCKELLDSIDSIQSIVISQKIKLIVIDSIAAMARKENLDEVEKEQFIVRQAATLKSMAEECSCVVLFTNQVIPASVSKKRRQTDRLTEAAGDAHAACGDEDGLGDGFQVVHNKGHSDISAPFSENYKATLGSIWFHCVSSRLVMQSTMSTTELEVHMHDLQPVTVITVAKSPLVGVTSFPYRITNVGVVSRQV